MKYKSKIASTEFSTWIVSEVMSNGYAQEEFSLVQNNWKQRKVRETVCGWCFNASDPRRNTTICSRSYSWCTTTLKIPKVKLL
jgi:hypothetical protein